MNQYTQNTSTLIAGSTLAFISAVVNVIPDPVLVKDREHHWVYLNNAFCELMGQPAEALLGKTNHDFFPYEEAELFTRQDNEVFRTGQSGSSEELMTDARGVRHTLLTKKTLYESPEDGQQYIVGVIRDVTEVRNYENEIDRLNTALSRQSSVNLSQAEEALRQSEAQYKSIYESNMIGIMYCYIDESSLIYEANDAFLNTVGYSREDLKAGRLDWRKMTPPEYWAMDDRAIRVLSEHRVCGYYEKQYIHKDGKRVDILIGGAAVGDSNSQCMTYVLDITARKEVERELQLISDALPVLIAFVDQNLCYKSANKAYADWFGLPLEQVIGRPIEEVLGTEMMDIIRPHITKALAGEDVSYETPAPYKTGGSRYIHVNYIPRRMADGVVEGVYVLVTDITSLKQTEAQLSITESRLRHVAEANIVGITRWRFDGQILDANQAFLHMTGYTREDLEAGRLNWRHMTPEDYREADEPAMRLLLETGAHPPIEKQYWTKAGNRLDVYVGRAFVDPEHEEGLAVVVDISRQKRIERELAATRDELKAYASRLEQSNKDLENFATVASHDLQAPLRKVQIFSDHLQQVSAERLTAEASEDLARIRKATARMQALINDLLTLSRVTRKGQPFRATDLSKVLEEVLNDLRLDIDDVDGTISVTGHCTIDADPFQMRQLFQNLLENALKFHRPGIPPIVTVTQSVSEDGNCLIQVRDNGIGLKQEHVERIFEIFQRLHGVDAYPGTGIGLSICKKIVERHGGAIWVESVPGEGSTFFVRLPIRQPG